jgi:phosphomannomutase
MPLPSLEGFSVDMKSQFFNEFVVKCSKSVKEQLEPLGFHVKQIPVGHTFLTLEAKQEKSPLGIESSGHRTIGSFV